MRKGDGITTLTLRTLRKEKEDKRRVDEIYPVMTGNEPQNDLYVKRTHYVDPLSTN